MPVRLLRPYKAQALNTIYAKGYTPSWVAGTEDILRATGNADDYVELATDYSAFQQYRLGNVQIANGEAAALAASGVSRASLQKLIAGAKVAFTNNARVNPVMSSPPTITNSTAFPTGADAGQKVPATVASTGAFAPYFRMEGGSVIPFANAVYPTPAVYDPTLYTSPTARPGTRANSTRAALRSTTYKLAFAVGANTMVSASQLRIIVNKQYATAVVNGVPAPIAQPASLTVANYFTVDFTQGGTITNANARSPQPRLIEIEAGGAWSMGQIWLPVTETITAAPPRQQILIGGDSWPEGPTNSYYTSPVPNKADGMAAVFGDFFDADCINTGLGGTGLLQVNGNNPNIQGHVYDLFGMDPLGNVKAVYKPAAIVIAAGPSQNDISGGFSATALAAAAVSLVAAIRAFYGPYVPVIFTGGFTPKGLIVAGNLAAMQAAEIAVGAALAALNDQFLAFIYTATSTPPWVGLEADGSGVWSWAGATGASTSDFHPGTITGGNLYLGRRLAGEVLAALEAMAA